MDSAIQNGHRPRDVCATLKTVMLNAAARDLKGYDVTAYPDSGTGSLVSLGFGTGSGPDSAALLQHP